MDSQLVSPQRSISQDERAEDETNCGSETSCREGESLDNFLTVFRSGLEI